MTIRRLEDDTDFLSTKDGSDRGQCQGAKDQIDLRRGQSALPFWPPRQNRQESRREIVHEEVNWDLRIRFFEFRDFGFTFLPYDLI